MEHPMNLDFEIRRAETVRRAIADATAAFRLFFENRGFVRDSHRDDSFRHLHLEAHLSFEAPHRAKITFSGFWNEPATLPIELLVTDEERVFWMNTDINREYMSFDQVLLDVIESAPRPPEAPTKTSFSGS